MALFVHMGAFWHVMWFETKPWWVLTSFNKVHQTEILISRDRISDERYVTIGKALVGFCGGISFQMARCG
jgi:hypothetical protein